VDFVNRDVGKFTNADLMASFCDRILKTGGEKLSDEEVEAFLEKTVQLFSYLIDKVRGALHQRCSFLSLSLSAL
jgi:cullin 1